MRVYKMRSTALNKTLPFETLLKTISAPKPKSIFVFTDSEENVLVRTDKRPFNAPSLFIWWESLDQDHEQQILKQIEEMEKKQGKDTPEETRTSFVKCDECGYMLSVSNWGDVSDCPQCQKPGFNIGELDGE